MSKIIQILLGLCDHKWEIIYTFAVRRFKYTILFDEIQITKYEYHLQCSKCGKIKKTTL